MTHSNPRFPENINRSEEHPLKEFTLLLGGFIIVLVIFVACVSYFAQALSPYIPFEWEKSWVSPDFVNQFTVDGEKTESDDFLAAQSALRQLFEQLIADQKEIQEMGLSIHLVNSDIPNAFATLGGHIFINTGLLPHIKSENGLAMVIAHEVAHITHRHPIQSLSRGLVIQLTTMMLLSDNSVGSILNQTSYLTLLSFNRDMESESDLSALNLLSQHYGHTNGADEFFSSMLKEHDTDMNIEFFNTHPNSEKRIEAIKYFGAESNNADLTPLPIALQTIQQQVTKRLINNTDGQSNLTEETNE